MNSKVFTKPIETTNEVYKYYVKKTGKKPTTIDEVLTYIKGRGYGNYFDDKLSNKQVIGGFVNSSKSLNANCTDVLQFLINMAIAMGGRAAEEMIFGHDKVTSGASSDIQQCTKLARNMVVKWGLSEKVGKIDYSQEENGYATSGKNVSADISIETAKLIDEEVKRLVDNAYDTASKILYEHRDDLEILAKALLEYETLTGDEIKELLKGNKPHRTSKSGEENKVVRKKKVGFGSITDSIKKDDDKNNNEEENGENA